MPRPARSSSPPSGCRRRSCMLPALATVTTVPVRRIRDRRKRWLASVGECGCKPWRMGSCLSVALRGVVVPASPVPSSRPLVYIYAPPFPCWSRYIAQRSFLRPRSLTDPILHFRQSVSRRQKSGSTGSATELEAGNRARAGTLVRWISCASSSEGDQLSSKALSIRDRPQSSSP